MNVYRRSLLLIVFALFQLIEVNAQQRELELGIDGLTCSMCSRSTEMSVRKLDFISDVIMDLEHTTARVILKDSAKVSYESIGKAVRDAGFSVRHLSLMLNPDRPELKPGDCVSQDQKTYKYIGEHTLESDRGVKLRIVARGLMPAKEFKNWSEGIKKGCIDTEKTIFVIP
jgi:cation transport ATPase